jgi:Uma2 family endonuclease
MDALPRIHSQSVTTSNGVETPPLLAGDQLSRTEFERRYHAHPEIKKAELIEGIVYMPSPVTYGRHANPHHSLVTWTGIYRAATPGVEAADNATVRLDNENEVQPDILLRLERTRGGRSFVAPDDYLVGAPELVVEIAASSANYDMHVKRRVYGRNGVQEYVVALMFDRALHWYVLENGTYEVLPPDADGILRSRVFPGLWLQPDAFWANDLAGLLATVQQGIASSEHQQFVARLAA